MMEITKKQRNAFVQEKYEKKKLPIAVELGAYHVDHLIRLWHAFNGDMLLPIILGEVGLFGLRGIDLYSQTDTLNYDKVRSAVLSKQTCNAYSISAALSLPRETVRRKVKKLITMGYLERDGDRNLRTTPKLFYDFSSEFNLETTIKFLAAHDRLDRILNPWESLV